MLINANVYEKYGIMTSRERIYKTLGHEDVLLFGSPEDCRREVSSLMEGCGFDGGLILRPSNMFGWDVPIENLIARHETARDYDLSLVANQERR